MIQLEDVHKSYRVGDGALPVIRGVSLRVASGEFVAIMGASGSGKTTLLNIIGCLDPLDEGVYRLAGHPVHASSDDELAALRARHIGFVFQLFNLLPRIDALRNVELPMVYTGIRAEYRRERALMALDRVGLADRAKHMPSQLSGGQQQRVAIARALVNDPDLIIADEPTGSLDSQSSREIMNLFRSLNAAGKTIVLVTHEEDAARHAGHIVRMRDGRISN